MIATRPATRADVSRWYPDQTASFRAKVCELDGEPVGIIGVALTRPFACLFSTFDEALRPYLKSMPILRLIKWAQSVVETCKRPVMAIAEPNEPTAPGILGRLGFVFLEHENGDDIYQYRGVA